MCQEDLQEYAETPQNVEMNFFQIRSVKQTHSPLQLQLRPPVSRLCLCIIDSQRRLRLANRLLRQFFFFFPKGGQQLK